MEKKYIIRHVCGNYIRFEIPFLVRTSNGGGTHTDTGFIPNGDVVFEFIAGVRRVKYTATKVGNVAVVEDNGTLPVGVYNIDVKWRDANNRPLHYMQRTILEVVESSDAGGVYNTDEFDVIAYYPVIGGERSAIVIENGKIYLEVGGRFGEDDDPNDGKAMITTGTGEGRVERENGKIILYI